MRVLLTNDDGLQAVGLQTLRRALLGVPDVELSVIAPDSNRSATARSITTRRPLWVEEVTQDDGTVAHATDGTPVDCVRLAALGLIEHPPDLIVSGINHGSNMGDDITYSGTVAAALEGVVLGIPAIAVSQQVRRGSTDFRDDTEWSPSMFEAGAAFTARLVEQLADVPVPDGTLLNVNCPAGEPEGVVSCGIGKRIYNDALEEVERDGARTKYRIYGQAPGYHEEEGTDFAAVAEGKIALTPLHFDLTDRAGIDALAGFDLDALLPAGRGA